MGPASPGHPSCTWQTDHGWRPYIFVYKGSLTPDEWLIAVSEAVRYRREMTVAEWGEVCRSHVYNECE